MLFFQHGVFARLVLKPASISKCIGAYRKLSGKTPPTFASHLTAFRVGSASLLVGGLIGYATAQRQGEPVNGPLVQANAATNKLPGAGGWGDVADVVEQVSPAVVSVFVQSRCLTLKRHYSQLPSLGELFAGDRQINVMPGHGVRHSVQGVKEQQLSVAEIKDKRFIVDSDGHILTNAHVVGRNLVVQIQLTDGTVHTGRVKAVDMDSDLALIKIDSKSNRQLPHLSMGSVKKLRPGNFVIALGSPLSLSNTVTLGVISAVDRDLGHAKGLRFMQTDASITSGNSGGPLVDMDGRVIAIATMKAEPGFSFAIPIDHAQKFMKLALERQDPSRPTTTPTVSGSGDSVREKRFIGIIMLTLTRDMLDVLVLRGVVSRDIKHGVLVHEVLPQSPSHRAGLEKGDIIVAIDGVPVSSATDVYRAVEEKQSLRFSVLRHGQKAEISNIVPERS